MPYRALSRQLEDESSSKLDTALPTEIKASSGIPELDQPVSDMLCQPDIDIDTTACSESNTGWQLGFRLASSCEKHDRAIESRSRHADPGGKTHSGSSVLDKTKLRA
jgi:hypothetical protein